MHGCQSSESEHEGDDDGDYFSNSDDNEGCVALGTDSDLMTILTDNNDREGGWLLESGEKVKDILRSMTSIAIEQAKKSKKGDACALSVIKCVSFRSFHTQLKARLTYHRRHVI